MEESDEEVSAAQDPIAVGTCLHWDCIVGFAGSPWETLKDVWISDPGLALIDGLAEGLDASVLSFESFGRDQFACGVFG